MDIRIAAYGVIVEDGRILLAHWNELGREAWTLPGGGLERGEDPADAARREILEETGFTAELGEVLGVDSYVVAAAQRLTASQRSLHAIRVVYRARITGGELANEVGGSTDQAAWFALEEVPALPHVGLVDVALGYLARDRR